MQPGRYEQGFVPEFEMSAIVEMYNVASMVIQLPLPESFFTKQLHAFMNCFFLCMEKPFPDSDALYMISEGALDFKRGGFLFHGNRF
jgi:hypothetical protein